MKKIPSLPLILLLLLPVSCHRPASTEQFVTIDKSVGGIYGFTLDLSDTLCAYDIWFYNRVEPALGGVESVQAIPLAVKWQLLDCQEELSYTETVYHCPGGRRGRKELYRKLLSLNAILHTVALAGAKGEQGKEYYRQAFHLSE